MDEKIYNVIIIPKENLPHEHLKTMSSKDILKNILKLYLKDILKDFKTS